MQRWSKASNVVQQCVAMAAEWVDVVAPACTRRGVHAGPWRVHAGGVDVHPMTFVGGRGLLTVVRVWLGCFFMDDGDRVL